MASGIVSLSSLALVLVVAFGVQESEAIRFRCGILSFLGNDRACRASCWITGHRTGSCDSDGNCNCSEDDLDLAKRIQETLGGLDVIEYVEMKYNSFVDEVDSWEISEKIRNLAPSRCTAGDGFCKASCHAIGRVTGSCNADYTDCTCSTEKVTPSQYALCVDDGVCSLYCQRKGLARGECKGSSGWDCKCISLKGEEQDPPMVDLVNFVDLRNNDIEY